MVSRAHTALTEMASAAMRASARRLCCGKPAYVETTTAGKRGPYVIGLACRTSGNAQVIHSSLDFIIQIL
jgi:hypothetical protein